MGRRGGNDRGSVTKPVALTHISKRMKPRIKFLIGAALVLTTAGYLMASSIRETGMYYLTPSELSAKLDGRSVASRMSGVKVGARVVPGSIQRAPGGREYSFRVTDGAQTYPVVYRGIAPDTFTDGVDVVVEGRMGAGRNVPRDDAAREVRVALRERARRERTSRPPATARPRTRA